MAPHDNSKGSSNPPSTLLQDMLREKKAQTHRVKKSYNAQEGDRNGSDDREIQSSPLASKDKPTAPSRRATGAGIRQASLPKEMSLKEMEQHVSKINKQNFDLKLEVFHRRQRNEALEAKVERLDELEADNAEMQSINEDLLLELEKRDVAIQEAVNLICELEAKIEEMGEAEIYFGDHARSPQAATATDPGKTDDETSPPGGRPDAGSPQDVVSERLDVSPTRSKNMSPNPETAARRIPSFMREKRKSTNVLRSLYSYDGSMGGPGSVFSGDVNDDEEDGTILRSPRLSLLSESGFQSVYGDPKDSDQITPRQSEAYNVPEERISEAARDFSPRDTQREARVQRWIEERNRPSTPTRASSKSSAKSGVNDRFTSIGEVLEKIPNATQAELGHQDFKARSPAKSDRKEARVHQRRPSSPAFGGPMFGGAMLPPTPGTMSTATIAASSSTPSIVTEKSLLDGTPLPAKNYSALIPDGRPQSSDSNLAIRLGNALAAEDSDRERESMPSSRSSKATRPSLTTSATDTVFTGDGYATILPARTLSYPSPTGRVRRPSGQLSPTSEESSGTQSSLNTRKDRSKTTVTPTRKTARDAQPSSSPPKRDLSTPVAGSSKSKPNADTKSGLRSRINKMSLTPNQSTHQSVTSRLFRRSNSHSAQPPTSTDPISPAGPPVPPKSPLENSKERLPRPTSLYGSSPIYGQRPIPNRPSSSRTQYLEREHTCESHRYQSNHTYALPSLLPDGMLTDTARDSSSRNVGKRRREKRNAE